MNENTNFIVYCIEEYKAVEHLNGKAVISLEIAFPAPCQTRA
jgi:hypothetical protein